MPTPKETTLIFSSREIRHVYTDGRQHTPKDELWATPWGDSIGHWEGQTLVIDTIAVKSAFGSSESEGVSVVAFGDVEGEQTITMLSPQAHFIERIRMLDKDHLEDQMTVIDPTSFTAPWHVNRTYERVAHIHRMVYEDCEGEERNPDRQRPFHARATAPVSDTAAASSAEQCSVHSIPPTSIAFHLAIWSTVAYERHADSWGVESAPGGYRPDRNGSHLGEANFNK